MDILTKSDFIKHNFDELLHNSTRYNAICFTFAHINCKTCPYKTNVLGATAYNHQQLKKDFKKFRIDHPELLL